MKLKLTSVALSALIAASPAMADLVFPDLSYRTGPYAAGGIPFSDGYNDYFTLVNERDGGIGGTRTGCQPNWFIVLCAPPALSAASPAKYSL